ncbi:MAG: BlaI/MecI/CopY family transcriptional regulator [Pirellulales bacterium]|nr:BlaI/MecI/CopY family transcriptional regulator [Pirellulales bacterium]
MSKKSHQAPTELELEILKVLWRRSPMTVREVQERLAAEDVGRTLAHTSVITMLHIMVRKRFLSSKKDGKSYLFWPKVSEEQIGQGVLGDVLQRVFDGSAQNVVLNLLEVAELDVEQLAELRRLIEKKRREQK